MLLDCYSILVDCGPCWKTSLVDPVKTLSKNVVKLIAVFMRQSMSYCNWLLSTTQQILNESFPETFSNFRPSLVLEGSLCHPKAWLHGAFSTLELNSDLLTELKFQPWNYYKSLLGSVHDYMRNFQPRAVCNPWVEI